MRFSLDKILPLLLRFIQMVSGTSLTDTSATLSPLRLVGTFSIGIEGATTPLTFTHTLNVPLAPITCSTGPTLAVRYKHNRRSQSRLVQASLVIEMGCWLCVEVITRVCQSNTKLRALEGEEHECAMEVADAEGADVYDGIGVAGAIKGAVEIYKLSNEDPDVDWSTVEYGLGAGQKRKPDTHNAEDMTKAVVKRVRMDVPTGEVTVYEEASSKRSKKHKKIVERKERKRRRKCCKHCKSED